VRQRDHDDHDDVDVDQFLVDHRHLVLDEQHDIVDHDQLTDDGHDDVYDDDDHDLVVDDRDDVGASEFWTARLSGDAVAAARDFVR
jgi:hypothetical protein